MSFKDFIGHMFWRRNICPQCRYFYYMKKHGPCDICRSGSEFKNYDVKAVMEGSND